MPPVPFANGSRCVHDQLLPLALTYCSPPLSASSSVNVPCVAPSPLFFTLIMLSIKAPLATNLVFLVSFARFVLETLNLTGLIG